MIGSNIVEVSYANGEVYKKCYQTSIDNNSVSSVRIEDGCETRYYKSKSYALDKLDKNFPFFAKKEYENGDNDIKYYLPSNDVYKLIEGNESLKGFDLSDYDLAPDVKLWIGIGVYRNNPDTYDIIFSVESDYQLRNISDYYNLKYPLPNHKSLDDQSGCWNSIDMDIFCRNVNPNFENLIMKEFKYGSVKFNKKTPHKLKMYESNYNGDKNE
jgi:hypothetical protein